MSRTANRGAARPVLSRKAAVLWAVAAGAALLGAGAQPWVHASGLDGLPGTTVSTTGNDAAAVVPAMALVGMAGGAALSIARRVARTVIAALLVLAGLAGAVSAVQAAADPSGATRSAVGEATGTTAPAAQHLVTAWPWVALAVSVALALCGAAVLVVGRRWRDTNRRYDSAAAPAGSGRPGDEARAPGEAVPSPRPQAGRAEEGLDEIDAWDRLSRGDDPT